MDEINEKIKDTFGFERLLELSFFLLILSFLLYLESITTYFYRQRLLDWMWDGALIKSNFGICIVILVLFGIFISILCPFVVALVEWCLRQCSAYSKNNSNIYHWYSLEVLADKEQSAFLQAKVDKARAKDFLHKQQLANLAQKSLAVLLMSLLNWWFAQNGLLRAALEYSIFSKLIVIFCLCFFALIFCSSVVDGNEELKISYTPEDKTGAG